MEYEAFVYKWINSDTGKYYIGKHKGTIDDGYISSGKAFLQVYNSNPNLFKRTILFKGTHEEVCKLEQECIKEAIKEVGHKGIYNLTTWDYLNEWKRTCLHCGSIVDPRNEEWVRVFEYSHFENCKMNSTNIQLETNLKANIKKETKKIKEELAKKKAEPKLKSKLRCPELQKKLTEKEKKRMFYLEMAVGVFQKSNDPGSIKIYKRLKEEYTRLTGKEI
jgi:hypothetical protein